MLYFISLGYVLFTKIVTISRDRDTAFNFETSTSDPLKYQIDNPILIILIFMWKYIRIQRVKWMDKKMNNYHGPVLLLKAFTSPKLIRRDLTAGATISLTILNS